MKVEQVAGTEHRWGHGVDSVYVLSPSEWQRAEYKIEWGKKGNLILQVILKCGASHQYDSEAEPLTVYCG